MTKCRSTNSLANNSSERLKKNANPFCDMQQFKIRELEISVTNKCNLTCHGCGFNVPNQVKSVNGPGIEEHLESLKYLKNIGLKIGKIVLVGGEATLSKRLYDNITQFRNIGIADQIELVTNGLNPQGITKEILSNLDSFVVSDYVGTDKFESTWRQYLDTLNYKGEINFRRKTAWDDLLSEVANEVTKTEEHWSTCFYRIYDVTLERGHLFSCSRIAKKNWDEQGVVINSQTKIETIVDYLTGSNPKQACFSCATVGNESQIQVAVQNHTDINKIISRAEKYMSGNL